MIYFSCEEIDKLISDDLAYSDLTTDILDIDGDCKLEFIARQDLVVCASEEAKSVLKRFDLKIETLVPSGSFVNKGQLLLSAYGNFKNAQSCYRICSNLMEHASGLATKTRNFVELAKSQNPSIRVATTRKTFPFAKKLSIKAILSGGASVHRLGLSESILIFKEHIMFMGGFEKLLTKVDEIKRKAYDKTVCVEVEDLDEAIYLAKAGIEFLQLDKFDIEKTKQATESLRKINNSIKIAVAGGINDSNVVEYAKTGVDSIVTSWLYFAKPADIGVKFTKIG
ncbi:MAG: ModD protein [Desulfurella sp.]|uniref:ModD protein n=1 Tax=Desulfurella TaxID=33001 RepID=UPI000CB23EB9|nr:ModD protein [Desulfurella multipotens]PMP68885.1 MAG: ModD protein [Desulfurella multipotens]